MNDEDNNLNETNKYIPKHAYNNEINNFDRDNTYTNNDFYKVKNDVVLDPFCGCGTTLVAAKNLNREYIGFEINKTYYNNILKRL